MSPGKYKFFVLIEICETSGGTHCPKSCAPKGFPKLRYNPGSQRGVTLHKRVSVTVNIGRISNLEIYVLRYIILQTATDLDAILDHVSHLNQRVGKIFAKIGLCFFTSTKIDKKFVNLRPSLNIQTQN